MYVVVRTSSDPRALADAARAAVHDVAPSVPVMSMLTMNEHLGGVLARTRWMATLLSAFALFALSLAVTGMFGIIAFSVQQRRSEIGLRIALGAQPSAVARMVAAQGFGWFVLGAAIGLPIALATSRALRGLLYEIAPSDPLTYGIVIAALLVAGVFGAWVPALRATRVDPLDALRAQ
jgi:putative ABC transport system permease protein